MKVSFITTVYNEEGTIDKFFESLLSQSMLPDEIIIVDGMSTDQTINKIRDQELKIKNKKIKFKLLIKKGNRSSGRNEAIKNATSDVIACSDAGNILDRNWIKNIVKPFENKTIDVVAGYYKGQSKNIFQKCLIPYVLVMPDKINPDKFLPATRSIAFTKKIWKKIGGFDEKLSHNEDYAFAKNLKKIDAKIVFAKDAIVNWIPRNNFKQVFKMFFRFAYGDAEAGIFRPKVVLIFSRYILGILLFLSAIYLKSSKLLTVFCILVFSYLIWAIVKNYKYVLSPQAFYLLPMLQLYSDMAVITGSTLGALKNLQNVILKNKTTTIVITVYMLLVLSTIQWGIPNQNHPYLYHMDEWHQFMSVKSVLQHGTPNIEGAAHGPIFQFLLSGIYLIPFVLLGIVQPDALKADLLAQNTLFVVLRINTLLFGIASLVVIAKIAKDFLKTQSFLTVLLFAASPIWISLSNYFKYDIALIFWILLSLLFLLQFLSTQTNKAYITAGIVSGLALATKISALPLIPIYIFSYFFFSNTKKIKTLFLGITSLLLTFLIFGIPDVLLGLANYGNFFSSNLQDVPKESTNIILDKSYWLYLFWDQYLLIFGHLFYILVLVSIAYWIFYYLKNKKRIIKDKIPFFVLISLGFFTLSLLSLRLFATGNRSLVLLPFFSILTVLFLQKIYKTIFVKKKLLFIVLISALMLFQIIESVSWVHIKWLSDPREKSSQWITRNIPKGSLIGIEQIPIYQYLPDTIIKEFYFNNKTDNIYSYSVFENKLSKLPDYIITTNYEVLNKYFRTSPSKQIVYDLESNGYRKVTEFYPDYLPKIFYNPLGFYLSNIVPMRSVIIYKKDI